ncbi:hypothetical protein Smar_1260 [Staphylothermus marinus F1]|uniref:Uncharacterized protein n=1 Tax=Staphylothermus marinus (strain ATCC 43588 / DSM 3639 / JCM 9404 / F1) TaxID=399550 RepID=A3DNZ2_STAMF|nr:hypothetical protein [Staphylothermus marinus]ABN70352.1 hypothetical protein Smar_1260 [Staphylothermus marinus F1]
MVASEKKEKKYKDVEQILINRGYYVTRKNISEKDLMGEEKNYEIIHAVSRDEKTVITIRLEYLKDSHRLHVSTKTGQARVSEIIADKLESLGLRVHEDGKQVDASGIIKSNNLARKVKDVLDNIG